jgi:hypothetical protein
LPAHLLGIKPDDVYDLFVRFLESDKTKNYRKDEICNKYIVKLA